MTTDEAAKLCLDVLCGLLMRTPEGDVRLLLPGADADFLRRLAGALEQLSPAYRTAAYVCRKAARAMGEGGQAC
jgi:hypothetical protein